jgi:cell division protein FtsB
MSEVASLRVAVKKQSDENDKLAQRNQALAADVNDLKHGEQAVEARARAELGLIKPGETFYQVVEKPANGATVAAPATSTSSGN